MGQRVGRKLHKLGARRVTTEAKPGYHGDGGGLWLQVSPMLTRSWVFRYTLNGKAREMGLGAVHTLTLAEAREKAREKRQLLLDGIDPIEARDAAKRATAAAVAKAVTFKAEAEAYIDAMRHAWKNAKHEMQWTATLETYAFPFIGDMVAADVDTPDVMRCLEPIWTKKTETAKRLRGRIEAILDRSKVLKHRNGDNPARWRGHLDKLLAAPSDIAKREHHAAVPYTEVGAFMKELRARPDLAARALELTILTATRTNETISATWNEIDLDAAEWTIPASRMKAKRPHRVPLSRPVVSLLKAMPRIDGSPYVFPGRSSDKPMSNMAMLMLLQRRMEKDATVHGFRSAFRDWAAEVSSFPSDVAEMALAHIVEDKTEAAYRRGDLFDKRVKMMQAWADYCARVPTAANVTPIRAKKA